MADNDLNVKFGASTGEAVAGIDQVKSALAGFSSPIQSAVSDFATLGKAIAGAFVVDKIAAFVGKYADMGEQIERTSAILGISTASVQQLGYIAQMTGGSATGMAMAIERLQLNLQRAQTPTSQQALALQAIGLSAKELLGVPIDEQMNRIADAVAKFGDGGNKTAIVMALLGRTGAQMIPVLDQGRAGLDAMRQSAENAGAVMSGQTVTALATLDRATVGLTAAVSGLAGTLTGELAPSLSNEESEITSLIGWVNTAIQTHTLWDQITGALASKFAILKQQLANTGVIIKDIFTGNWGAIAADTAVGTDKVLAILRAGWQKETDDATAAMAKLKTILAAGEGATKPQAPALGSTDAIKSTVEQYQALAQAADKAYSTMKTLADDAFAQTSEKLKAEAAEHKITYGQETAGLLSALDTRSSAETDALGKRYTAEYQALSGEMAQYAQGSAQWQAALDKRTQAYQDYEDELSKLDAKTSLDRQKIEDDAVKQSVKNYQTEWTDALKTVESSFNSQLRGLLAGTTTWQEAWRKMLGDMIIKFIEMCETMVVKWAAVQLAETTASVTGASTRAAADSAASSTSALAMIGNALKAITVDAGQAFGGVFAFLAPTMGPAAAGPAAAASATVLGAATSLDVGTNYVTRGGLALIHSGEEIKPAQTSGPYNGAGNRGGDIHTHFNFNSDAKSFQQALTDNGSHLMRVLQQQIKRGAHLSLRGA